MLLNISNKRQSYNNFIDFLYIYELFLIDMQTSENRMLIDNTSALILEGGGMRGVFTCGVLDNFMDRGLTFPYTVGVSAGACNGLSFMSHQRGRARYSNIDMLDEHHYIGLKYLWKQHNIMDFKLMFDELPNRLYPYDYHSYADNPDRFEMVTTSCETGNAVYYEEKNDPNRIIDIVKASSSLPFVCPIAYVDGRPMLDGGIADSIPIERAFSLGYKKLVVVLTRNKGYRKKDKRLKLPSFIYKKYPQLREALKLRSIKYNRQLELVERLEDDGKIIVIRPEKPLEVDRIERDTRKLQTLYDEGYRLASSVELTIVNK